MSGEYDWVAFNGAITMEHVTAADLEAQGVAMTWLPDDTSLWITGHHVPVANLWCVDPEIGSAASGLLADVLRVSVSTRRSSSKYLYTQSRA